MDHNNHKKIQILKKFSNSQYLKKAIQLVFSVSVISFIFSNSSFLSFLVHFFNTYFSTISTYSAERNYIFLLFNGILVIIVKSSGLIGSLAMKADLDVEQLKESGGSRHSAPELSETKALVAMEMVKEIEEENERDDGPEDFDEEQQDEVGVGVGVEQEDNIRLLSTEELNKKCDEFIRKMKEGIKIEAKQLIMV